MSELLYSPPAGKKAEDMPSRALLYEKRLSHAMLSSLVLDEVDRCQLKDHFLGNLNLKFPLEAQLEMVRLPSSR